MIQWYRNVSSMMTEICRKYESRIALSNPQNDHEENSFLENSFLENSFLGNSFLGNSFLENSFLENEYSMQGLTCKLYLIVTD